MGLSFSVAPQVRPLPRSLENIFTEYTADLGYPKPSNGDLSVWAQRGVLLLNRVLTVAPGSPASHRGKGWEAVTECAIRALVARRKPMVAILWGRDAQTLKPMLNEHCLTVESPHPSPLSASRGSSGHGRSAAPTICWRSWVPTRSTGDWNSAVRLFSGRASARTPQAGGTQHADRTGRTNPEG